MAPKIQKGAPPVTKSSGNVFTDLNVPNADEELKKAQDESHQGASVVISGASGDHGHGYVDQREGERDEGSDDGDADEDERDCDKIDHLLVMYKPYPTMGRIVHFFAPQHFPEAVPAMITRVHNATLVDLTVFPPGQNPTFAMRVAEGAADGEGRRWFWPPRD